MQFKNPKNTAEFFWTMHSVFKMRQYGLSEQKIKNVIRRPERKEEGVAKNTVAVMQPVAPKIKDGRKTWKQEIWTMYQKRGMRNRKNAPGAKYKIISVWRYPGVSPAKNPIPEEILREMGGMI